MSEQAYGENRPKSAKRSAYILTIWQQEHASTWRGYIETPTGTRQYFSSTEQLTQFLRANGWQETNIPNPTKKHD